MSIELIVLKLCCENKDKFIESYPYLRQLNNIDNDILLLFKLVNKYYETYSEINHISEQEFITFYDLTYPLSKNRAIHIDIIHTAFGQDINNDLAKDALEKMVERHFATKIINDLIPLMEGEKYGCLPKVRTEIDKYISLMRNPPRELRALEPSIHTVGDLIDGLINNADLLWPLSSLNKAIGGVRLSTNGLVYAFVDSGKTSFSMACCASFAQQLKDTDKIICYAGNEEASLSLNLRLTQALLKSTKAQIRENKDRATQIREELGFSKVKLFDGITKIGYIKQLLDQYGPRVLIIDQGTKVDTSSKSEGVKESEELFNIYREFAKEYSTSIISVVQGTGESENKKWLNLSDIYGSRVAIQGELDYAIGIGRTLKEGSDNLRYIHVPKNKFGDTVRFVVEFDKHHCDWREL